MDRAEKIGLSSAVVGHALLIAAFYLGLFSATKEPPKPEPITVSLVGEVAPVSTAPDAIQEEPAPAAPAVEETPAEPPPAPQELQVVKPVEREIPRPLAPTISKPQPSRVVTPVPVRPAATPPKPVTKPATSASGRGTTPARPGSLSDNFERSIAGIGKTGGQGKAVGTPAAKTAAEVKRSIDISIKAAVVAPWNRCKILGATDETRDLVSVVRFSLTQSGGLAGISSISTSGKSSGNLGQVPRFEECAKNAIRQAAPFSLPSENYAVWQNYTLTFTKNR